MPWCARFTGPRCERPTLRCAVPQTAGAVPVAAALLSQRIAPLSSALQKPLAVLAAQAAPAQPAQASGARPTLPLPGDPLAAAKHVGALPATFAASTIPAYSKVLQRLERPARDQTLAAAEPATAVASIAPALEEAPQDSHAAPLALSLPDDLLPATTSSHQPTIEQPPLHAAPSAGPLPAPAATASAATSLPTPQQALPAPAVSVWEPVPVLKYPPPPPPQRPAPASQPPPPGRPHHRPGFDARAAGRGPSGAHAPGHANSVALNREIMACASVEVRPAASCSQPPTHTRRPAQCRP
jgi:hypothetical protein